MVSKTQYLYIWYQYKVKRLYKIKYTKVENKIKTYFLFKKEKHFLLKRPKNSNIITMTLLCTKIFVSEYELSLKRTNILLSGAENV